MNIQKWTDQLYNEVINLERDKVKKQEVRLSKKYFSLFDDEKEQLLLFEELLKKKHFHLFSIATLGIKNNPNLIDHKYFSFYEKCLYKYIDSWEKCDQYCYRVLNPLIEKYSSLHINIIQWAKSDLTYVKRAAPVCLIHSSIEFSINVDFMLVEQVSKILLEQKHIHIQKGVGWLLKYSYLSYPQETVNFIKTYSVAMSAVTFRYSLEKMPSELKQELKKQRKIQINNLKL